jgi:AcrR family transcriptional regulator
MRAAWVDVDLDVDDDDDDDDGTGVEIEIMATEVTDALPRPPDLHWIRPPRQLRTHQSLERVLDVAEAMLRDKDFDDIHVSEIANRAETSVAAFYRRFKDKEALLHALHARWCEEAYATADDALARERWEGAGVAEILFAIFPFLIETLHSNESLDRAIYQRSITDQQMRERSVKLSRYVVDELSSLLLERDDEIHHPDPGTAVAFALIQALALLVHHYTVGIRNLGPAPMSDELVTRELVTSCLAYLGISNPYAPIGGDRS